MQSDLISMEMLCLLQKAAIVYSKKVTCNVDSCKTASGAKKWRENVEEMLYPLSPTKQVKTKQKAVKMCFYTTIFFGYCFLNLISPVFSPGLFIQNIEKKLVI